MLTCIMFKHCFYTLITIKFNVTSSAVFLFVFVVVEGQFKNISVAQGSMPQDDVSRALIYTTYTQHMVSIRLRADWQSLR